MLNSRSQSARFPGAFFFLLLIAPAVFGQTAVFINEIHYDNVGTDAGEFIEIAGPAGTNLSAYSIVLYNGANGASYDTDSLTGIIPDQQNGFGTASLSYAVNGIQNGSPDGVALIGPGQVVIQFLSYEGTFTAVGGPASGLTSTDIAVSENGSEPTGLSLQLQGTGTDYEDFTWTGPAANTSNAINTGQSFGDTPALPALSINNVTVTEGNAGTTNADFTVSLSSDAGASGVTFDIATADVSASAGIDYESAALNDQLIPAGFRTYSFTVIVNGDTEIEPNETFEVTVTNVSGATVSDGQGIGTIANDDNAPPSVNVIINELDSDTPGADTAEFVELYDGGAGNTSLSGLVVVFYNGNGDVSYAAFDLDGRFTDAAGYFTLGNATVSGVDLVFNNGLLQNGADAVALYQANGTDFPANTPVSTSNLVDALVYDTGQADDAGLLVLLNAGQQQVNESQQGNSATASNQRCPNGGGGARNTSSYLARTPTPDGANSCPVPPVAAAINAIQGSGAASPFVDRAVITSGIVTALKSNGFFMQESDSSVDLDPATSEGIFVFTGATPSIAVRDVVNVTGTVVEFFNLTQVSVSPADITRLNTVLTLPSSITLTAVELNPAGALDQLERFEGMRVRADSLTSVAPTNEFGEVFTVLTGVPRPFREEGIEVSLALPPGAPASVPRWDQNPERIMIDTDGLAGSTRLQVTSHVTFTNVEGPLDFNFGDYKILPETTPVPSANLSADDVPVPADGEFTVGSMNLRNFFTSNPDFALRLNKASLAVRTVMQSPDIIGVEEIGDLSALQSLADKINADTVAAGDVNPGYEARLIEADDDVQDDIDVGFLVKTSRVGILSVTQEGRDATFINPLNGQPELLNDRPPLILRAAVRMHDSTFTFPVTVIVNHLRSLIDVDQDPGEGPRVRAKRRAGAEFLAGLVQSLQSENLISVGDYNAFQLNDGYVDVMGTIQGTPTSPDEVTLASGDLVNPNLTNLLERLSADQHYSFIFQGTPQVLDHVLVNFSMASLVSRFAYARNNSDFPDSFGADSLRPERLSDHDMPVAYFSFPGVSMSLDGIVTELQALISQNPGSEAADKLEDVLDKVLKAIEKLNKTPPDLQGAAGELEGAIGDLEAAHKDGLISDAVGRSLLLRLTGANWLMARQAIEIAVARNGNADKINEARKLVTEGDALVAVGKYKDAAAKYRDAISKAEGA